MRTFRLRPLILLVIAAATSGVAAAMVALFRFNPAQYGFYPRCPFFVLTGLYCPGCGMLRATHQLLHGNLVGAADYNVFFVLFLPVLLYFLLSEGLRITKGRGLPMLQLSARATWALLGLIAAFTLVRNLPYAPFTVLAP
jgi:hypothetical protein